MHPPPAHDDPDGCATDGRGDIPSAPSNSPQPKSSSLRVPFCMVALACAVYIWSLDDSEIVGAMRATWISSEGGEVSGDDDDGSNFLEEDVSSYPFQCDRTWSPQTFTGKPRCANPMAAFRFGTREERDGDFFPWQPDKLTPFDATAGVENARPRGRRCGLRWYSPTEACALLAKSGRLLVFIGDSLLRHLEQAMYIVLTGNYSYGGMLLERLDTPEKLETCRCETQFNDGHAGCRAATSADFFGVPWDICPNWDRPYLFPYLRWYMAHLMDIPELNRTFAEVVAKPAVDGGYGGKALILVNDALHNSFEQDVLLPRVYEPVIDAAQSFPSIAVFCMTMHAPQANKPAQHWETQGPAVVERWNAALRQFCTEKGARVFETHSATFNATSYDGTHFGMEVNVMLAQALLNAVAALDGDVKGSDHGGRRRRAGGGG